MKFNASLLKVWSNCQLQARFREIEKRPYRQHIKASFGVCIHDALERYNEHGDVERAKTRFKQTWGRPELLDVVPEVTTGFKSGSLRERGLQILDEYHEAQMWEEREIIAREHKFCVPFGDHLLSGAVDLVEFKVSGRGVPTLRIVDFKTNTRAPTIKELRLDIQFTVYDYASRQPEFWMGWEPEINKYQPMKNGGELYERFIETPRRCTWYHLWGNKEIDAGDRDQGDFERLYFLCNAIEDAVNKEVFIPSIRAESCTFCDYKDSCGAVFPILDKLEVPPGGDGDDTMF